MIYVEQPTLEQWRPDFSSSGQASPNWTRLKTGEWLLTNSLEAADWEENPVQALVCDACGTPKCSSGGYVHVSRTALHVVWTAPQIDKDDPWTRDQHAELFATREEGAVLFSRGDWDAWAAERQWMATSSTLSVMNGRALCDAWRCSIPLRYRPSTVAEIPGLVATQAVAADPGSLEEAVDHLRRIVELLESAPRTEDLGDFQRIHQAHAVTTIYFDSAEFEEWSAYSILAGRTLLTFSRSWYFQPGAGWPG